ncbi:serologically defined colon cancer antigen 1 [Moelleriella libera RCEF 2490]|uniref:Ribosome quality control complex subunit 2 n=1 Tax=Moelleriella libera RCEF 2490 TaxID=1081109 RepID=A0A168ET57_9HYPO|nr:serologically defined colon cancer antigen 1 [Moelleriella libera RCEF 2490]
MADRFLLKKVIAHELNQSLATLRLANVYDLSSKILLFKFAKPDKKKQLVIDIGFRCHLTKFARTAAAAPSAFVLRIRKLLKTRRLASVQQVGTDRILEFRFSDGQYRMFLEFFASGNVILTDADLNILCLSRNVSEGEGQELQRVGLQYSLDNRQNFHGVPELTRERVQHALQAAADKAAASTASQRAKVKPGSDLRKSLAVFITELPPVLVDHVLQSDGFDTTVKPAELLQNATLMEDLVRLLSKARESVEHITNADHCIGYIFAKCREGHKLAGGETASNAATVKREGLLYEDFQPFIPHKLEQDPSIEILKFEGYNETVDEFFSSLEGQKLETRLSEREATAKRKLDAARADQVKRLEGLQEAQTLNMRKAAAIEANVEWVQEAMDAINGLLAQGMDWHHIGKLVEREQSRNNPVATMFVLPLNIAENLITLNLAEEDFEEENDEADPYETDESGSEDEHNAGVSQKEDKSKQPAEGLHVEINLTMSPWSNAREYYEQRRTAVVKEEKTQQQAARALKSAEQKISEDLKRGLKQEKALLQPIRKQLWFEKFSWFISSDGYLVLGGRDAQQNEMLYKKHLRKGDIYCHADLRGAPSVVIKNNASAPDAPIPPATLAQAGCLSVCASEAWDQKAGMGAWWVKADQVSKSAPAGEFLPIGSFMVRDQKNFLPPAQLLLGLGVMFKISEQSKARHVKHRILDPDTSATSETVTTESYELQSLTSTANTTVDGDEEDKDSVHHESDDEGEDQKHQIRDNPLQRPGSFGTEDEVNEAVEAISSLEIDEDTARTVTHDSREHSGKSSAVGKEGGEEQEEEEGEEEQKDASSSTQTATAAAPDEAPGSKQPSAQKASASSAPPKAAPPKHGLRGRAKKRAARYKDQDEEDRLAAEAVIGAAAGRKRLEAERQAKQQKAADLEAAKERRRLQHQREQREIAEHEEIRRLVMDEGGVFLEPDEAEQLTALDGLVGTPLPGDEILEAVPVCAPWNALGKFKYKAKLQPGPIKKGKAVKEVMERWKTASTKKGAVDESARDTDKMWPREMQLIKAMKVEDIVNCVPAGKVRVMMGGGGGSGGGSSSQKYRTGRGGKGKR